MPLAGLEWIIGAALLAGAIFFHRRIRREKREMVSWPSVVGSVTSSEVVWRTDSDGDRSQTFETQYGYTVEGKQFDGSLTSSSSRNFETLKAKYAVGSPVNVYYNPLNPKKSNLKESLGFSGSIVNFGFAFFLYLFGLIFIIIGILSAFGIHFGA